MKIIIDGLHSLRVLICVSCINTTLQSRYYFFFNHFIYVSGEKTKSQIVVTYPQGKSASYAGICIQVDQCLVKLKDMLRHSWSPRWGSNDCI